jgi:hypothetical protein
MASKLVLQVGFALTLAVVAASLPAAAQDAQTPLYASGRFPSGRVYTEGDLDALVGHEIQAPAYLTGRFMYLGESHGARVFSTFAPAATNPDEIAFGQVLIKVRFRGNVPPGLAVGKAIVPTPQDPLTLKRVWRSQDSKHLLVDAESWSAP